MRQWIARNFFCNAALALLALLLAFAADARAVSIALVPVGNPGNANDPTNGIPFGTVAYSYSIGKYDVTVGQYRDFLNAVAATDTYGLYNPSMATNLTIAGIGRSGSSGSYTYSVIGSANHPITYVSWADAARFSNWLNNGQPTGGEDATTTEHGAYKLNGATSWDELDAVTRNPGATWFIPSESEWYKAAYYNPATQTYFKFPTSSNTAPTSAPPGSTPNTANTLSDSGAYAVTGSTSFNSSQNYLTDVGAYTASASPYGAFDLAGDVYQWNDTLIDGSFRGFRGSSYDNSRSNSQSYHRFYTGPLIESNGFGFRMAMIPEPSSLMLAAVGFAGLVAWLWRRRKLGPS